MSRYVIYKDLRLMVTVEAESAQEAWEQQLELDDNTFDVVDCDYEVWRDGECVSDEVNMQ